LYLQSRINLLAGIDALGPEAPRADHPKHTQGETHTQGDTHDTHTHTHTHVDKRGGAEAEDEEAAAAAAAAAEKAKAESLSLPEGTEVAKCVLV
jgi:hypothetical protein